MSPERLQYLAAHARRAAHITPKDAAELVAEVERLQARTKHPWYSLCVECGPNVSVDEDGCCAACGATAMGAWLNKHRAEQKAPRGEAPVDPFDSGGGA